MTAVATPEAPAYEHTRVRGHSRGSQIPLILFLSSCGFLLVVVANALSRSTLTPSPLIFWAGIALVVVPSVYRLAGSEASRRERVVIVGILGMGLYAIKVARDPLVFSYADELVHAYNALSIHRDGVLFGHNPILPATPYYPGLESSTAALTTSGGVSVFTAGVVIVGCARLLMMVALFSLLERISGSARVAGLGTAVYTANANFLYFDAQFSYESLALALLVGVLAAVAQWRITRSRELGFVIVAGTAATVVTHHLSSVALAAALCVVSLMQALVPWTRERDAPNPWRFAVIAVVLIGAWTVFVGNAVIDYLRPVFEDAAEGVKTTLQGDTPPRTLFRASPKGVSISEVPLLERAISIVSVPILFGVVLLGLWQIWRKRLLAPFQVLLALAGLAYFGTLALRLTPTAWEVGNRASGFLFLGVGFVVACSRLEDWRPQFLPGLGRVLLTGAVAIVFAGGVIAGWPAGIRLSQPVLIEAEGTKLESESVALGRWVGKWLPGNRFAAPTGDARWALLAGDATVFAGNHPDVQDVLLIPEMQPWMRKILRDNDMRYVITDRRFRGTVAARVSYFELRPPFAPPEVMLHPYAIEKFAAEGGARVFDSGFIVVFDREPGA